MIDASNGFAFELFRRAAGPGDNHTFISPLSVSMVLGMSLGGAAGTTFDSIRVALGLADTPLPDINASYRSLIALLRSLDRTSQFQIANSIWYRDEFSVAPAFLESAQHYFDARAQALDFSSPGALTTINQWVSAATAGKIPTILEEIDADDMMFLVNAIYFKGRWRSEFDRAHTAGATFQAAVGGSQEVRMMRTTLVAPYFSNSLVRGVDLPYGNGAFAMTVLLPQDGVDVATLVDSLTSARWTSWMQQLQQEEVQVRLPKFRLEYGRRLDDDLSALGMRVAFDPARANFGPLTTTQSPLYLGFVKHKTFVDVYEDGTEAAAVTIGGTRVTCACGPVPFTVDRPFVFVIRERLSGTILFVGKMLRVPAGPE